LALLLFGGFIAAMATTGNQSFTLTDLGPGTANALNAAGSVVGSKPVAGGTSRAYIWTSATQVQTDLGIADSSATGVNDSGVVVGAKTASGVQHAFRWASGATTDLGTLPGFTQSAAADVNASGQIVGSSTGGSVTRPFLFSGGAMSDLGTLGGSTSTAAAINDAGTVVGTSLLDDEATRHAFAWDTANGMEALGDLDGNNGSVAMDVNDAGDIVGSSFTAEWQPSYYYWYYYWVEGPPTATLWRNGVPVALGGPNTNALAVNDATADHGAQIVGEAYDASCGEFMPVLWEVDAAGQVTSRVLDESLNAAFAGYLSRAGAINDAGQLAVSGSTSTLDPRAFLLGPSTQPPVEQALHAPSYFTSSAGAQSVSLWWGGVCGAESYVVQRGTAAGGPYQTIASGLTQTSYVDTSAPLGATYHYVVAAVKGATQGASSADLAAAPLPYAPTALTAKALTGRYKGQAALSWTGSVSGGVTHYKVFRIDPNGARVLVATTGAVSSYTATGLKRRTRYGFYVTAVHSGGQESAASNTVYVTAQ
jgi:probable HAF family extracellular repeat protein